MNYNLLVETLLRIRGCTFASLDARTAERSIIREVKNERVLLYSMKEGSGYERKVRRALVREGRDPDSFRVGPLPWGNRIENLPLIEHKGIFYLQTVLLSPGEERYFIGVKEVPRPSWVRTRIPTGQGLSADNSVYVHTYRLDSLTGLRLMGEVL